MIKFESQLIKDHMNKNFLCYSIFLVSILLSGCATTPSPGSGKLGTSGYKSVVILGENVNSETAKHYANKYNAKVLYKPGRGFLADAVSNSIRGTLGPSRAMMDLIRELKSINNTEGAWKLIISSSAERYFLVTLRNMDDNAVGNAHGKIILLESSADKEIEQEVARVFGDGFEVIYKGN